MVSNSTAVLATLLGICAFYFFLQRKTQAKVFTYLPPLIWIYMSPVVLANIGFLPAKSDTYTWIKTNILPAMLVILLLKVDIKNSFKLLGRGLGVMLFGTLGVVVGAPIAYLIFKGGLGPDAWKAFGTLAGSWIGGTGNMAAVSEMVGAGGTEFGLAVIADNLVYIVWLPIMLGSKNFAGWFNRFTGVTEEERARMEAIAESTTHDDTTPEMAHYLFLAFIGFVVTAIASYVSSMLPEIQPYISQGTWRIVLVTLFGLGLSLTPASKIPGSHAFAMAMVYLFVANMGARAQLEGIASQAFWFVGAAFLWIFIHGAFCLLGAKLLKVDVHTAAIASAANVGGAASAPIVAAHHKESLVPVSILMALVGYAIGNFAAYLAAILCKLIA